MKVILDFFASLGQYVIFLVDFVINILSDITYMTKLLGEVVVHLPDYLGWMPSVVATFFLTTVSIVVIYKILGRE